MCSGSPLGFLSPFQHHCKHHRRYCKLLGSVSLAAPSASPLATHAFDRDRYFPIGPFQKYSGNPILSPNPSANFESAYLYNPCAIVLNETIFLLYRAQNESKTSTIGLAWSTDGYNFTRLDRPILYPTEPWEQIGGCEDPRIVRVNQTFYLTYTGFDNSSAQLCMASSQDMLNWVKYDSPLFPGWQDVAFSDIDVPSPRLNHSKSVSCIRRWAYLS